MDRHEPPGEGALRAAVGGVKARVGNTSEAGEGVPGQGKDFWSAHWVLDLFSHAIVGSCGVPGDYQRNLRACLVHGTHRGLPASSAAHGAVRLSQSLDRVQPVLGMQATSPKRPMGPYLFFLDECRSNWKVGEL